MRDIRQDIRERIADTERRVNGHQNKIADCESQISASKQAIKESKGELESLRTMLAIEDSRWASLAGVTAETEPAPGPSGESLSALQTLILGQMADGEVWQSQKLVPIALAHHLLDGSKSPARSVHATMIALYRRGLVESLGDGAWRIKSKTPSEDQSDGAQDADGGATPSNERRESEGLFAGTSAGRAAHPGE